MQFRHPEILYALLFLIIPLIVHLFQLRKFRKEKFTNVKFLKRLTDQTRKSSKLKKWLVLTARMLLLAALILAFAQPYFPSQETTDRNNIETLIYLDNSYSMQAQGPRGRLLERSLQELQEHLPEEGDFTLITNDAEYSSLTRDDLQEITYSPARQDLETFLLSISGRFSMDHSTKKNLLMISDFQEQQVSFSNLPGNINIYALPLRPKQTFNIQIDTAFISRGGLSDHLLTVQVSQNVAEEITVPLSLYNGSKLLGKSSVDLFDTEPRQLEFPMEGANILDGTISVEDTGLQFDNSLFFSLNDYEPMEVVSINAAEGNFLNRIFTLPEFNFTSMPAGAVNYNALAAAQVVILNEIAEIPVSLQANLREKIQEEAVFIIIPSSEELGTNFHNFVRELGFPGLTNRQEQEKFITGIAYNSPLFSNVFEEETRNFEYPKVQVSYGLTSSSTPILSYQDQRPFLISSNGNFLFTAPLSREFSNFTASPLVVPTFYNMGTSAMQPPQLYYNLGRTNSIDIPITIQEDNILQIASEETSFIPLQQNFPNRVRITLEDLPEQPGNYTVLNEGQEVLSISFNVDRKESAMVYQDLSEVKNITTISDTATFFTSTGYNQEEGSLWKWFVTFALIFLLIETLLLKYLK